MAKQSNSFYAMTPDQLFRQYRTRASGLSNTEAETRHRTYGDNALPREKETGWLIFYRQLKSPLLLILVFAAGASYYFGQHNSALTIVGIMALSVVLGFANEYHSEKIIRDLHTHIEPKSSVLREGLAVDIPTKNITIGDLVPLLPGTIVPADLRLIDCGGLQMDESALTGESTPADKTSEIQDELSSHKVAVNCAYAGTNVVSGHGLGIVIAIASDTKFGQITKTIARLKPETDFQRGVANFGYFLLRTITIIALIVFIVNVLLHRPVIDSLLFALAIAIGLTPELLPAIISISMAQGAHRMAKKKVVVKQLVAIENFGNLDVLCTDKTGTLTEGKPVMTGYYDYDHLSSDFLLTVAERSGQVARPHHPSPSPFDAAVVDFVKKEGKAAQRAQHIAAIQFDFERRRSSTVIKSDGDYWMITKGAPEPVLEACRFVRRKGSVVPIDEQMKKHIKNEFLEQSKFGFRVLAYASRAIEHKTRYQTDDETNLIFEGLVLFEDRIKLSVTNTINRLKSLDIRLCLVSGDHELVCRRVYSLLDLPIRGVATGDQLDKLNDDQLREKIDNIDIFARVTPEQKLRVIRALKAKKQTVGFMGDGINDAPSIHESDVGISVASAVDIARDAATVVLLRQDLGIIADGVEEGRRIFSNTIKYILMGTSSNFGNMISAALGSFVLPFLPMLPTQILLLNVMYDSSQIPIPTDNVDQEDLRRPSHWNINFIQRFMVFFGPISSLYDVLTFAVLYLFLHATQTTFQTGWYIESLMTQTLVIFMIRTKKVPAIRSLPSWQLATSAAVIILLGLAITVLPIKTIFGFANLPILFYVILAIMIFSYLVLVDLLKLVFYRRLARSSQ